MPDNKPWNRRDHLPIGHRLYSSPDWVAWFLGKPKPLSKAERDYRLTLPPLPDKFLVLNLDDEAASISLTARLARYLRVRGIFADISAGRFVPTKYPPFIREPLPLPIYYGSDGRWHLSPGHSSEWHGPLPGWRERAAAIWVTLPANDSDIFDRHAVTERPKHGHLAERLAPLLDWKRARVSMSFDATNWLVADNDSYFDGEEPAPKLASNRERRIRPGSSIAEIKSFIKKAGPCREWTHAKLGGGGARELIPTDPEYPARAGRLRFSIGKDKETCHTMRDGKVALGSVRTPAGAILYQPDKFGELLGPEPDPKDKARRRSYWTSLMSWDAETSTHKELEPVRHNKAGRVRRKVLMTQAEQLEVLATQPHPPVRYYKPGLPCGAEDLDSQFVGGWISKTKGKAGVERWQDVSDELSRQAEFDRWFAALPEEQRRALDLACIAANFREIGETFGKTGKNAERYGKTILIAANDNLKKVMAA